MLRGYSSGLLYWDVTHSLGESAPLHPLVFGVAQVTVSVDLLLPEGLDEEFVMNESRTHLRSVHAVRV